MYQTSLYNKKHCFIAALCLLASPAPQCQCQCSDEEASQSSALNQPTTNLFFYNRDKNVCESLPLNCNQNANCSFHTLEDCQLQCESVRLGGCQSTLNGCCDDGQTAKPENGECPDGMWSLQSVVG